MGKICLLAALILLTPAAGLETRLFASQTGPAANPLAADVEKIAAEITKRFPVDKQRFPTKKDPSVYKMANWPAMDVFDPDGINFQLFQIGYDGAL